MQDTQAVRASFGASPAEQERQVRKLSSTMLGTEHVWHSPVVENVVPLQLSHPLRSAFGPLPAGHALHWLADACTTRGDTQAWHSTPKDEKRPGSHETQAFRASFGASPGPQAVHVV